MSVTVPPLVVVVSNELILALSTTVSLLSKSCKLSSVSSIVVAISLTAIGIPSSVGFVGVGFGESSPPELLHTNYSIRIK